MPFLILVGGGSASGKSYVTSRVIERIGAENITRLTLDDYYKDMSGISFEERCKVNYDHPKSFDWKLMEQQLTQLKSGQAIEKPIYDFKMHLRSNQTEIIKPAKIIMVEGIMALVNARVRKLGDLKVFVNCSRERRLLRRLERDQKERGRTFDSIVNQYFYTVQPMYEEVIAPSSNYADLIINNDDEISNLAIDVLTAVLKEFLENGTLGHRENNPNEWRGD